MRDYLGRIARSLTGDWRYPAALAGLIAALVFSFMQYRQWAGDNDTARLAQFAIRQNDQLRMQIDALTDGTDCRSQIAVDVDTTKGQVILLQGQLTATVGQMIVDLFAQNRDALADEITHLSAINQLLAAASTNYREALDRRAETAVICTSVTTTTTEGT